MERLRLHPPAESVRRLCFTPLFGDVHKHTDSKVCRWFPLSSAASAEPARQCNVECPHKPQTRKSLVANAPRGASGGVGFGIEVRQQW